MKLIWNLIGWAGVGVVLIGCRHAPEGGVVEVPVTFAAARQVLETNCVHCHGDYRLKGMPPIDTTRHLAKLIGPGNWIVPGQPEKSRFFQVVIFPDEIPGAMPPTGHGIAKAEVEVLRQWIVAGAPMPEGRNERLRPLGEAPRSR
jgi:mono/diheme cytochrome c family protein